MVGITDISARNFRDAGHTLLQPGTPPLIGKAAFHDFMKQAFANSPSVKGVKYVPDIRDIQVAGNVAYEWGYFEALLIICTDGVTEAPNASHEEYGEPRLLKVVQENRSWPVHELPTLIQQDVQEFSAATQADDITAIVAGCH